MKRALVVRVVAIVLIGVFVAGTWLQSGRVDLDWLKFFSAAVLIASVVLGLWDVWLWRLSFAQRIARVPRDIRGTWKGTLTSLWADPVTGITPSPKTVYLVVRQTATALSVRLVTNESASTSTLAGLVELDSAWTLIYTYLNRPDMSVEHRSRMHHGSAVLDISGFPARRLKGRYWTDRDSKGELDFDQRKDGLAYDFRGSAQLFDTPP